MSKYTETRELNVIFTTEDDRTVRINIPNPRTDVSSSDVQSIVTAGLAAVDSDSDVTLIQATNGANITALKEAYTTTTVKNWIVDPVDGVSVEDEQS